MLPDYPKWEIGPKTKFWYTFGVLSQVFTFLATFLPWTSGFGTSYLGFQALGVGINRYDGKAGLAIWAATVVGFFFFLAVQSRKDLGILEKYAVVFLIWDFIILNWLTTVILYKVGNFADFGIFATVAIVAFGFVCFVMLTIRLRNGNGRD